MKTYQDGYQDGWLNRPQRQKRRPYATGYKRGREASEAESKMVDELARNEPDADRLR